MFEIKKLAIEIGFLAPLASSSHRVEIPAYPFIA
jgi:hypothetical protein